MNDPDIQPAGTPPPMLVAAVAKLLRPLVRLLLSFQITYPLLINLLKSIYVEVSDQDFRVGDKRPSDSRITLLTGVHRKDVKRLRAEPHTATAIPTAASVGAQLIGRWLGSKDMIDAKGQALPLALKSSGTDNISFEALVEQVCKQDIRPRVILDEWLRLGVAHLENDHVVLNTGAFTPDKGFEEKAFFFGKNTQDHISVATHNLLGLKPSYFDRSVYYDQLTKESVDELAELANTIGMQALTELNKEALLRQERDKSAADASHRMNFGIFNFNAKSKKPRGK